MTDLAPALAPAPTSSGSVHALLRRFANPAPVTVSATLGPGPCSSSQHVLGLSELEVVLDAVEGHHRVLMRSGGWTHEHAATYLDSADLAAYHTHRFELRLRDELRSGASFVELTLGHGPGRATTSRPRVGSGTSLSPAEWAFAASEARAKGGLELPAWFQPTLSSRHRSAVLVSRDSGWRLTVDFDMVLTDGRRTARLRPDLALVTLTSSGQTVADGALARAGVRDHAPSAYCAGVSLLRAEGGAAAGHARGLFDLALAV